MKEGWLVLKEGLFSIIVPCYNVEQYVRHCVQKLQEQEYTNFEVILVDDGSTDGTYEECLQLKREYDNITVACHLEDTSNKRVNLGVEATRNKGLDIANGEYVFFLDADDSIDNTTLKLAKKVFDNYENVDFILTGFCYSLSDIGKEYRVLADLNERLYECRELIENFHTRLPMNIVSCMGTKIYRRQFLEEYKIRFDRKYRFNEDGAFALDAFMNAQWIYYINKPLYYYYQRTGSTTYSYRENAFVTVSNRIDLEESLYKQNGISDSKKFFIIDQRTELIIGLLREEAIFKGWKSFCKLFRDFYKIEQIRNECREVLNCEKGIKRRVRLAFFLYYFRSLLFIYYKTVRY